MYSFAEFISVQLTLIEANNCIFLSVHIYSPDILSKTRKCDPGANRKPRFTVYCYSFCKRKNSQSHVTQADLLYAQ